MVEAGKDFRSYSTEDWIDLYLTHSNQGQGGKLLDDKSHKMLTKYFDNFKKKVNEKYENNGRQKLRMLGEQWFKQPIELHVTYQEFKDTTKGITIGIVFQLIYKDAKLR